MSRHTTLSGSNIHTPFRWVVADAAARTAPSGFTGDDLNKVCLQLDTGAQYVLTAPTPTWLQSSGTALINPMTTADDIIVGGASGAPTRVAKGAINTVWGVDAAGVLGYKADPSGGGSYPTRATMWHDEATVVAGNILKRIHDTAQNYFEYPFFLAAGTYSGGHSH